MEAICRILPSDVTPADSFLFGLERPGDGIRSVYTVNLTFKQKIVLFKSGWREEIVGILTVVQFL